MEDGAGPLRKLRRPARCGANVDACLIRAHTDNNSGKRPIIFRSQQSEYHTNSVKILSLQQPYYLRYPTDAKHVTIIIFPVIYWINLAR